MSTSIDEATKLRPNMEYSTGTDSLREDYQNAVDCIVYCESIIKSLQEKIDSKDKHISSLEEKVVQMSLELASSKAFEDMHRSKRRVSDNDDTSADVSAEERPPPPPQSNKRTIRHVTPANAGLSSSLCHPAPPRKTQFSQRSQSTQSIEPSQVAMRRGGVGGKIDLDDSCSSRLSNFGQLFRRKEPAIQEEDNIEGNRLSNFGQLFRRTRVEELEQVRSQTHIDERPRHRAPTTRRRLDRRASSRMHLSGVLFPVTSEDCMQGCFGKKSMIASKNEEWPEFK